MQALAPYLWAILCSRISKVQALALSLKYRGFSLGIKYLEVLDLNNYMVGVNSNFLLSIFIFAIFCIFCAEDANLLQACCRFAPAYTRKPNPTL